jgi:hypothetical protein
MDYQEDDRKFKSIEAVLSILALLFIIWGFERPIHFSDARGISSSIHHPLNKLEAITSSGSSAEFIQKSVLSTSNSFKILNCVKYADLENTKANIKISVSRFIQYKLDKSPPGIFFYHLFPVESDDFQELN